MTARRKIKDIAGREEARAHYRGEGLRVCEEFEVGTRWKEDCNTRFGAKPVETCWRRSDRSR